MLVYSDGHVFNNRSNIDLVLSTPMGSSPYLLINLWMYDIQISYKLGHLKELTANSKTLNASSKYAFCHKNSVKFNSMMGVRHLCYLHL